MAANEREDEERDRRTANVQVNAVTELDALPVLLTADEVACLLRTTRAAIYALAERGGLPGIARIGRRLLVRREVLLRSLFEGRAPSPRGTRR